MKRIAGHFERKNVINFIFQQQISDDLAEYVCLEKKLGRPLLIIACLEQTR